MSTLPEQISAARQAQVDAQLAMFQTYATKAVEKAEKIIALNLSTTRASMAKSSAVVFQLLASQDPRDLFALTTQTQASFESMLAYSRELFSITAGAEPQPAKQATPVIAPPVPEQPPAPKATPQIAPEAKAEAPVPAPAPAAQAPARAKPIAKAVSKAVPPEAPAKPAAVPFPVAAAPVVVTSPKPAAAPAKSAEPKQLDMLTPKAKAKKNPK
jgi:phasin family protein